MATASGAISTMPAPVPRPTAQQGINGDSRAASTPKVWVAVVGASLGASMAVLNIQIVNASLADIQGAIGAGVDDGGWITTAYLIAEIIVIPLTGWLAQVFSLRAYLLANAALFLFFSAACAHAQDLGQMIALRAVQGSTGGVLIPMAFTITITLLPKAKQPVGLALFALSATFAPAIGPTIGGYLTENFGWQYVFYVNLAPGALMLGMLWVSLDPAPMRLGLLRRGDWPGIATMAIGLAALQTVLEEGKGRLVRLAPHRPPVHRRGRLAQPLPRRRADRQAPTARPAPAGPAQLRLRHPRQLPPRRRALRVRVRPARLPLAHPGLQFRADRPRAGLDRAEATHKSVAAVALRVRQQATIMAFGDTSYLLGAVLVVALAAVLLLKPGHVEGGGH